ncbi:hypothetical protein PV10_02762 [Exophiala mesophila]|uniref:histidine kinase n=1 Tax=Exophiala mesophila TaxID=212818 RepID=A0A0D1Y3A9_EXOME|nr:uncharacterized protein PV10_02762 [Exophiala mesophila]KIV95061.1 hypothetical protein PV10_02762 [Exophiala mesophila]
MDNAKVNGSQGSIFERQSICLHSPNPGVPTHAGEDGFEQTLANHYTSAESIALEKLTQLKRQLNTPDIEAFWKRLMEGMTDLCGSQYAFVAKRVLVDDHDSNIEMPPIGEHGSCLLGVAFYYNDGDKNKALHRDYKYMAWNCPCAHMKHDKVFLIPNNMTTFIQHNPNAFPFPAEAYIGIPLFQNQKCFAHFGLMWSEQGLSQQKLSWANIEMLLHSLEDIIVSRLISGLGFAKPQSIDMPPPQHVIPRGAVNGANSLKPYAKSLSHELRTPMQGVVGMLDVMHATVQEQIEGHSSATVRRVFQTLKENIETVQDSSKRAVEAADNVVHAYDMNMQVPGTPLNENDSPAAAGGTASYFDYQPSKLIEGSNIHVNGYKRRRSSPTSWQFGNATKIRQLTSHERHDVSPRRVHDDFSLDRSTSPRFNSDDRIPLVFTPLPDGTPTDLTTPSTKISESDTLLTPGSKHCQIRELIPTIIHDALRVGGRPDSAIGEPLDFGERIVVRSRSSNGHTSQRTIEWTISPDVPETSFVDEKDFSKLVSAVLLNAIKFTENGEIKMVGRMSGNSKFLILRVSDTGDGIPEDFQPELFKAFSRENDSLTRSREGLGLGLLVAKGLARRLGGDILLIRSNVSGPDRGSEFEIRVPLDSSDGVSSRTATPRSATPEHTRSITRHLTGISGSTRTSSPFAVSDVKNTSPTGTRSSKLHTQNGRKVATPQEAAKPISHVNVPFRKASYDRALAEKYPLTFLVAEDNKINRKLLVNMLGKLGYKEVYEAYDGKEAVRVMRELHNPTRRGSGPNQKRRRKVDVVLMDLWMPEMDGYEATQHILSMFSGHDGSGGPHDKNTSPPIVLAVSADVTDEAISRATKSGMEGFMTKPYKLMDLQKLIVEFCVRSEGVSG